MATRKIGLHKTPDKNRVGRKARRSIKRAKVRPLSR
jgi:hypothetical protein